MVTDYLAQLKFLWFRCPEFYEQTFSKSEGKGAIRFAILTSLLVALEIGLSEAFSSGTIWIGGSSLRNVGLVTGVMLAGLPFAVVLWVYLWTFYMGLCGVLMGETLPKEKIRSIVAYSVGGLVALGLGFGLGGLLTLVVFVFQYVGFQKVLGYSRWQSAVYVGFPFSLVAVMAIIFTLMFKVFK
jgi:hypothetical protein